jgi:uncharacterized protein YoxC
MSFWSLIGLPDKKDMLELKSEINSLKEENKIYAEMKDQLIKLAGDINKKCDIISEELSDTRTKMNTFIDDINSEFRTVHTDITEIRDTICLCTSDFDKQLKQLSGDLEHINSSISAINDIDSELKSLTEYVNCLWSATKALWIDSLISDLDDSIDFESEEFDEDADTVKDVADYTHDLIKSFSSSYKRYYRGE